MSRMKYLARSFSVGGLLSLLASGCDDPHSPRSGEPASVEIVMGDNQTGAVGAELPMQIVVRIVDVWGRPVEDVYVLWVGDGLPWVDITDTAADGITRNYWNLGEVPGPQRMELWLTDFETATRQRFLVAVTATALPR